MPWSSIDEQHVGPVRVGPDRDHGRARHLPDGGVVGQPLGHHARAQVLVGDDPQLAVTVQPYEHRGHGALGHAGRGVLQRGVRLARDRRLADERAARLLGKVEPAHVGGHDGARLRAAQQRPRQVAQARANGEQRQDVIRRQRVAERVLVRADLEPGRHAGDHRRVAEQLALAEQVQDAPVVHELDRPRRTTCTSS